MSDSGKRVIDQRLVRAVAHPLRVEILEVLVGKGEMSPTQIAATLQSKPGNVSYHVNVLRECEVLELVRTEPRRGRSSTTTGRPHRSAPSSTWPWRRFRSGW